MQILGKRSKVLLIAVAIAMLVAIGVSFAAWDSKSTVKAASGNSSTYANAKVGDIIEFGNYYQTGNKANNLEYEKTAIKWIVVDKDERAGQLTLLSEKILAAGSYFGNYYYDKTGTASKNWGTHYDGNTGVGGISYNQAYVDSTVRAYLNNLERLDLGGDQFTSAGYLPSNIDVVDATKGLLSSIGFSNQKYWTGQNTADDGTSALLSKPGFVKRANSTEIYYQRPISVPDQTEPTIYQKRPATLGFYDEAFSNEEKAKIVPKVIAGYIGHRWPARDHDVSTKTYVEGTVDKVWIPSATELNVMEGQDWNGHLNDSWTNPSDEAGSTVFEYFKNYSQYSNPVYGTKNNTVADAIKTTRTTFAGNSYAMNYSIPVYNKGTTTTNDNMHSTGNSTDYYWTRSPMSSWVRTVRIVNNSGLFYAPNTYDSNIGVRPCVILKY